jgi:hypothetical protein
VIVAASMVNPTEVDAIAFMELTFALSASDEFLLRIGCRIVACSYFEGYLGAGEGMRNLTVRRLVYMPQVRPLL